MSDLPCWRNIAWNGAKKVQLEDLSADAKEFHGNREEAEREFEELREELVEWQRRWSPPEGGEGTLNA